MSDWFYNKELSILTESEGYMSHGSWINGSYSISKTIACDVQPANREKIFKEYGYYIDCNYRVFCNLDTEIKIGGIVEIGTAYYGTSSYGASIYSSDTIERQYYKIEKIIEWDDYFDMFVNEYKGVVNIG